MPDHNFRPGDLVSVAAEGKFGVAKVLVTDAAGVHIRLYQERFDSRPLSVDAEMLTLGSMFAPPGEPFSIGHLPLSYVSFLRGWEPQLIITGGTVGDHELEGYRSWEEAEGGYW